MACNGEPRSAQQPLVDRDFDEIVTGRTLTALLMWNSTGYFVYRGEAMGCEYELLRACQQGCDGERPRSSTIRPMEDTFSLRTHR
jgi:hypothetical protein